MLNSIFKTKWSPDTKVKAACNKYVELKETHAIKLLKAARSAVNKLKNYFEIVDLTDIDDNGRPIYQAKDLVANLSKMADVVNGLSKLEELVKKEQQTVSANRGGVVVITKQKDLNKLYKELNENDKDYFSLPFNFSDVPSIVDMLVDHYESLEDFEKCTKLKTILQDVQKN